MNAIHEICQHSILTSNMFSKKANDYLIQVLEDEKDGSTALSALLYNSRYQQLDREQRLRLLKLVVLYGDKTLILSNYSYINRARKYEIDYLMDNVDIQEIVSAIKHYPEDYKTLISGFKNEKLVSAFIMAKLND